MLHQQRRSCFVVAHIQEKTNFLQISKRLEKTIQVLARCVFHIVAFAVQDQTRSRKLPVKTLSREDRVDRYNVEAEIME